ncbi:MAG: glycosyltransferase family 39 protein [Candidatus Woesebacteria bacterium]|nr:glycosyltransferase family 39 protein [Candidatus Woesebacteria bacterium]
MKLGKFKEIVLLILIILLSLFLRFYKLGEIPNGLYVDEAVSAYNAHSILETGKDEYGKSFPMAFRFFGSYSPPLYTYLTTIPIKIIGLSALSARLISALSGVVGVLLIYFFFSGRKGLIASGILAISPWAIFYSRVGYEINLGFILLSLGILFLWLGINKPRFLFWAYIILSLSTYGAHFERYLAPFILITSIIVFRRFSLWGTIVALIIQIPNIYLFFTPAFFAKGGLFYQELIITQVKKISIFPTLLSYPLSFVREFASRYLGYFSPRNLFLLEDYDLQRSAPGLSVFYFWLVVPYLAGLYQLIKEKKKIFNRFLMFLLVIIPIPLALIKDPFSSQRGLPMLLPMVLVITLGFDYLLLKYKKVSYLMLTVLIPISFIFLWRSYFVLLPYERANVWNWGFDKLTQEIVNNPKITYVIDQERIKPFYIEFAFFSKLSPEKLQNSVGGKIKENYYTNIVFNSSYKFQNIETRGVEWEKDIYKEQILVGDELTISESQAKEHFLTKVFEIRDPANEIVFVGYKTDPTTKCLRTNFESIYCRKI